MHSRICGNHRQSSRDESGHPPLVGPLPFRLRRGSMLAGAEFRSLAPALVSCRSLGHVRRTNLPRSTLRGRAFRSLERRALVPPDAARSTWRTKSGAAACGAWRRRRCRKRWGRMPRSGSQPPSSAPEKLECTRTAGVAACTGRGGGGSLVLQVMHVLCYGANSTPHVEKETRRDL